jgi:predicted XRE-type DNA-binding protein
MNKVRMINGIPVEMGSGNVYADLGYPDGEAMLAKSRLVAKLAEIIRRRGLTQVQAAAKLGMTQPKVSALLKGRFRGISEQELLECVTRVSLEQL